MTAHTVILRKDAMPTTDELAGPQALVRLDSSAATGQPGRTPEDKELTCSPWLGLHYRAEEG